MNLMSGYRSFFALCYSVPLIANPLALTHAAGASKTHSVAAFPSFASEAMIQSGLMFLRSYTPHIKSRAVRTTAAQTAKPNQTRSGEPQPQGIGRRAFIGAMTAALVTVSVAPTLPA